MSDASHLVSLDPAIVGRLDEFRRRRILLLLRRGLYAGMISLGALVVLLAAVDYFLFLEDITRYALSLAGYLAVIVLVWCTGLNRLVRRPDRRELAMLIEAARPDLREDLLSAVELGYGDPDANWDSPVFRQLLQQDVASRVSHLDVASVLPRTLLKRWARTALVTALLVALLLLVPGLPMHRLYLRALFPGLNIERISRTRIEIVTPDPADTAVPRGDAVAIVARIRGVPADEAFLEAIPHDGPRSRVRMERVQRDRFAASLDVGQGRLLYRVRAGDAMTRKYRLTGVPPPAVTRFTKRYRYPAYLGWADRTADEPVGDLEGPEGTTVRLDLLTDQPVSRAALSLDTGGGTHSVPLVPQEAGALSASVVLRESGTYKVHLVARQTGFQNRFSPEYAITVQVDLVPAVDIVRPAEDRVVMPDDMLELAVVAQDDFGLTLVQQLLRVNEEPWRPVDLEDAVTGTEATFQRAWDLLGLGVKPGDRVFTRFVATDLKGLRGESDVLCLTVGSPGLAIDRLRPLEVQRRVSAALRDGEKAAADLRRETDPVEAALRNRDGQPASARQARFKLASAVDRTRENLASAERALQEALEELPGRRHRQNLGDTGKALSRLRRQGLEEPFAAIEQAGEIEDLQIANRETGRAMKKLRSAKQGTRQLAQFFDSMLAAEEAARAEDDLHELRKEQESISAQQAASSVEPLQQERLRRKQEFVVDQLREVASQLGQTVPRTSVMRKELKDVAAHLEQAGARAQAETPDAGEPSESARETAHRIDDAIQQAQRNMQEIARRLDEEAAKARRGIRRLAGTATEDVQTGRQGLEEWRRALARKPPQSEQAFAEAAARRAVDLAAEMLRDRADWQEQASPGEGEMVRDMDRAAAAIERAAPAPGDPEALKASVEQARRLAGTMQDLEAGHEIERAAEQVRDMAARERWGKPDSPRERAREWRQMEQRHPQAKEAVRKARLPREAVEKFAQALKSESALAVENEMAEREHRPSRTDSMEQALSELGRELSEAVANAEPAVSEARNQLAGMAPSLSDRLREAEAEARALQDNIQAAVSAADSDPRALHEQVHGLQERQQDVGQRIDAVQDTLRRDATAQDMSTSRGRERARDAEVATAMLNESAKAAAAEMRSAVAGPTPSATAESLEQAADKQRGLADTLDDLAGHYEALEAGEPALSRAALRAKEDVLGMAEEMAARYAAAERLAELAAMEPATQLAALEQALGTDPAMRDELSSIVRESLKSAAETMAEAAGQEGRLAKTSASVAGRRQQRANELARRGSEMAKRADTFQRQRLPRQASQANAAGPGAQPELARAAKAMQDVARQFPREATAPKAAAEQAARLAGQLGEAAGQLEKAGSSASADASSGDEMGEAGREARAMEQEAGAIRDAWRKLSQFEPQAMALMASRQEDLTQDTGQVAEEVSRAGRHESRLGMNRGQAIQDIGSRTRETAGGEMSAAQQALASQAHAGQATAPLEEAAGAAGSRAEELAGVLEQYENSPPPGRRATSAAAPDTAASQWMARALDQLDRGDSPGEQAGSPSEGGQSGQGDSPSSSPSSGQGDTPSPAGSPGQGESQSQAKSSGQAGSPSEGGQSGQGDSPSSGGPSGEAASEVNQAMAAQASAMAQARREQGGPRPSSGSHGAPVDVLPEDSSLSAVTTRDQVVRDWGELPERMARELSNARRERVSEEYRTMVDAYFETVAAMSHSNHRVEP